MKKTLIALAAVAATVGVAHAQSSVTLYGRLDASFARVSTETNSSVVANRVAKLSQTGINSNNLNTTFWGLRGSEDLGGGLRAIFALENGFSIDTGANTGDMFARRAEVGLAGGFGTVELGRGLTSYDTVRGSTNHIFDSNFAVVGDVWATGIQDYTNRQSNQVRYSSPVFGGFSGGVSYSFGENKNAVAGQSATDAAALNIKYANGPLYVGYAFQSEKAALVAGAQDKRKYNLFGATYDFGVAKLYGSYNNAKSNALRDKEYQVGVSMPFGAAAIHAGYARSKSEGAGNNNRGKGYALVGTYDLSKRTTLYAGYETTKVQNTNGVNEAKRSNVATGVRHTF